MENNIFEKLTVEEQEHLWMYMIFNHDKIKEKTEQWAEEAEKAGMTLTEYLETISPLNNKEKWFDGENRSTVYTQENTPALRDRFADDVFAVFSSANAFLDFIEDEKYSSRYDAFLDYNSETYIINRETGKYINWYKASHIGRDIHTNVEPDKIAEFLREFKEDNDGIHED